MERFVFFALAALQLIFCNTELYKIHDEWLMKYWPFSSEEKRARIPIMNMAGFCTWCVPAADFDRLVWGVRITGVFFISDDYIDTGRMLDRIPGFKHAATGAGVSRSFFPLISFLTFVVSLYTPKIVLKFVTTLYFVRSEQPLWNGHSNNWFGLIMSGGTLMASSHIHH